MLGRYKLDSLQDHKNALKEIIQEVALLGLWRAKFFEKAAFYGGTTLRILHDLNRFPEDLDFTLLRPNPKFDLAQYEKGVFDELKSLGFSAHVEKKKKVRKSSVDSAFIKVNTIEHLFLIGLPQNLKTFVHKTEVLKIRFEVDSDHPIDNATYENKLLLLPIPFSVRTLQLEDFFAGKLHATLCGEWKEKVKGRDWCDFIWFVAKGVSLNLNYLEQRMRQTKHWVSKDVLKKEDLINLFEKKIGSLDIKSAKGDMINFINDPIQIKLWLKDFFREIVKRIKFS